LVTAQVGSAAEGHAWHADHKVAVRDGGGECNLDNLTTLCVICHNQVTINRTLPRHLTRPTRRGDPQGFFWLV
jgi:5-methylcytosine-specific restriction endonuclease McrA